MAHFLTLVLLPADEPDPARRADEVMTRYWGDKYAETEADTEPGWYNPNAKCDGFVIGGRYDGIIWGKEQHYNLTPDEFQRRYGLDVVKDEDNIRPVSQLVPDLAVYAIVTPDGEWHDREECQTDAIWTSTTRTLLARHNTCVAVAIDCHC